jgi:hypothetical protein
MAYPVVSAPYGLKPINLIGGQVFAGSTRELPIQYGYSTGIYYGDVVGLVRGFAARLVTTTGAGTATGGPGSGMVGVFLGCSFTNPVTKQKTFSQYWPASTLAGDAVAIVCDDPDTVFKAVMVSGTTVVASGNLALVGQNLQGVDNTGSVTTGNSANAMLVQTTLNTAAFPFRCVGVVKDTAVALGQATWSTGTTTLTVSALPNALPVGTDVAFIAANGQTVQTGTFVGTAATAGSTSVVLNSVQYASINAGGASPSNLAIPASSVMVFTQYPEVLVKLNFSNHEYYYATPY